MRKTLLFSLLSALCLTLFSASPALAQQEFKSPNFPVPFGPDNIGTDFFLSFPANWEFNAREKYIRVYISAGVETEVRINAGPFSKTIKTIPNDIVSVDIANAFAQAFVRNDQSPVPDDKVYPGAAVTIEADDPIIVYAINRTTFTSDGILALPVNGLGRQYIVAAARSVEGAGQSLPSQYMIVAPYDNTVVTIFNSDDTPNHAEGELVSVTLQEGDVYSGMSIGFGGDLSGTQIYSTNPVAVLSGQNCTYLPDERYPACDHIVEMLLPVESWGKYYHSLPYQDRTRGDTYRIFAGESDAEIYINGTLQATLPNVGGANGSGWIEYRQDDRIAMEISSNKRIMVAQYNNSQTYDQSTSTDPFFVLLTPVEQYQTDLIFTTPADDFATNYVQVISDSLGLEQIEIARAGTDDWQLIRRYPGGAGYRQFPNIHNGLKWAGMTVAIQPGVYRLRGPQPFAGYIYGGGSFDSYGYPLSVALGAIDSPDTVAPVINFTDDCDGSAEGTVTDLPNDPQIRSNLSTVRLHPNSTNYNMVVADFRPGIDPSTSFTMEVVDATQDALGIIVAFDMAANVSYDTLRYFARNLEILPDPLDFGEVFVGDNPTQNVTLTNNGNRDLDIIKLHLKVATGEFTILDPTDPFVLPAGGSIPVQIRFGSNTPGPYIDTIGVEDTCGITWMTEVRGTVVKPVIKVSDWDYQLTPVNVLKQHELTIRNTGTGTLRITGATGPNLPVFTLPNGLPAFPLDLRPEDADQLLLVYFTPTMDIKYLDTIYFEHNAPPDPAANDSIGVIEGEGILATLFATGFDWPKKRVGTGPYTATVEIVNSGSADARIFGLQVPPIPPRQGDLSDFDIVDEETFRNVVVPANGGRIPVEVVFTPTAVGNRAMKVTYRPTDATDTTVFSLLTGIGVVPGLETNDLNFGSLKIGDPETTQTVDFTLAGDPLWRDTVWIERFDFVSDNANGTDDFRYEIPAGTTFPIVLIPGASNSITVTGYFTPQAIGPRDASILAVTRDGVDTISNWVGVGTAENSGIQASAEVIPPLCLGETDTIAVDIRSTGQIPLNISDIRLIDATGEFTIVEQPQTPFAIPPGGIQTVKVFFAPVTGNGPRSATIEIDSDDPDDPTVSLTLNGEADAYVITGEVELVGTTDDEDDGITEGVLGENLTAHVKVNEALAPVGATGYQIILTYDPDHLLGPTSTASISLDPAIHPAGADVAINTASRRGRLILDVTSPTALTGAAGGDLIKMDFGVVFNSNLERSVDVESVSFTGAAVCATIAVTGDAIAISPICGLNLRMIDLIDGAKYNLTGALPNPVTGDQAEFEYSIAIEAPTTLQLFDAAGNLVATIVDQQQVPGTYRVALDTRTLPSGTYRLSLQSNQYAQTKPVQIAK